jgi:D-glycerate 3-kinase
MDRFEFWGSIERWVKACAKARPGPAPLLVGLCAPQGAGKTTLTAEICRKLAADGIAAVALSIDDFYLTRAEQADLARRFPDNRYLRHRGLPGTHDVALGVETLTRLKALDGPGQMRVPAYDRSAFSGLGDRAPEHAWPVAKGPLDVVILEGWMLGFRPVSPMSISDAALRVVNTNLAAYAQWDALLDAFIWIEPEDNRFVLDWRVEAEDRARAAGRPAMSREQTVAFVETFLPCYALYYRRLRQTSPVAGPYLHFLIGRNRLPVGDGVPAPAG